MPGKIAHTLAGGAVGMLYSAHRSEQELPYHQLLEAIGGGVAGCLGGRLPDILEPADSSWHRGVFHSGAALMGFLAAGRSSVLDRWEAECRGQAEHHRKAQHVPGLSGILRLLHALAEIFWRVLAGGLGGFGAGYASHLVMDGFTARSLPAFG